MTTDELKIWFWDNFNSCYPVEHKDHINKIFMIYDINYIRAKKLANILNKDVEYPIEVKGICLFVIDFNSHLFNIDYDEIWTFFEKKYKSNYQDIFELISNWMEDDGIFRNGICLNNLLPKCFYKENNINFKNTNKIY